MNHWLNVHHPVPLGDKPEEYNKLYVQEVGRRRIDQIFVDDVVFIYETAAKGGESVRIDNDWVVLSKGDKGLVAATRVSSRFKPKRFIYDGKLFIGEYDTEPISHNFVPLEEIQRRWPNKFTPHMNGGLRELTPYEASILRGLMGF